MGNDFFVKRLGKCSIKSPIHLSTVKGDGIFDFVRDEERILLDNSVLAVKEQCKSGNEPLSFEKAGPKEHLYFEPAKTRIAIVTCGGLCPGLNNVIRGIVNHVWERYGVNKIYGIQYGYSGFVPEYNYPYIELTPDVVDDIH